MKDSLIKKVMTVLLAAFLTISYFPMPVYAEPEEIETVETNVLMFEAKDADKPVANAVIDYTFTVDEQTEIKGTIQTDEEGKAELDLAKLTFEITEEGEEEPAVKSLAAVLGVSVIVLSYTANATNYKTIQETVELSGELLPVDLSFELDVKVTAKYNKKMGTVSLSPKKNYKIGTNVTATVTPKDGYVISSMKVAGKDIQVPSYTENYALSRKFKQTFEISTVTTDIEVEFEEKKFPVNIYVNDINGGKVTVNGEEIELSKDENSAAYKAVYEAGINSTASVVVESNKGYGITSFTVNQSEEEITDVVSQKTRSLEKIKDETTINVSFAEVFTISLDYNSETGEVAFTSPESSAAEVEVIKDTGIKILVTPNEFYRVLKYQVGSDLEKTFADNQYRYDNPLEITFEATQNTTVSVTFAPLVYNITIDSGKNGTVETSAAQVNRDGGISATITPKAGYTIKTVEVKEGENVRDNIQVTDTGTAKFTLEINNIIDDITLTVTYKKITPLSEEEINAVINDFLINAVRVKNNENSTSYIFKDNAYPTFTTNEGNGLRITYIKLDDNQENQIIDGTYSNNTVSIAAESRIDNIELYYGYAWHSYSNFKPFYIYFDDTKPDIQNVNIDAQMFKDSDGNDVYYSNQDVKIQFDALDVYDDASGIDKVWYSVKQGEEVLDYEIYKWNENESIIDCIGGENYAITLPLADYNGQKILLTLNVKDRVGNDNSLTKYFVISNREPIVNVSFASSIDDEFSCSNTLPVLRLEIAQDELFNEDSAKSIVSIESKNGSTVSESWSSETDITGNTVFSAVYEFKEEDFYTVTFGSYKNKAGTPADIVYQGNNMLSFVYDKTAPTGSISVNSSKWEELLSTITFGLYSKTKFDVTIEGTDELSGIHSLWYWIAEGEKATQSYNKETLKQKRDDGEFTKYNGSFQISNPETYAIYACIVDSAGNETYISSNGMIVDKDDGLINLSVRTDIVPAYTNELSIDDKTVEIPVYDQDVYFDLAVRDDLDADGNNLIYSGIKTISYKVLVNGSPITIEDNKDEVILFSEKNFENPSFADLVYAWDNATSEKIIVAKAEDTNTDNVAVEVTVTDNAGNVYKKSVTFGINIDNPSMKWEINGTPKTIEDDRGYYHGTQGSTIYATDRYLATVYITDRTTVFNQDGLTLTVTAFDANGNEVENAYEIDKAWYNLSSEGDRTTYAKNVYFNGEAYFDVTLSYENKNRRSVSSNDENNFTTKGDTPLHFTIDNTPPTGSITATKVYIDQDGVEQQQSNSWNELIENETLRFGFYSSGSIEFNIESFDNMAGVKSIGYYVVEGEESIKPLSLKELQAINDEEWKDSLDKVDYNKTFVVYARIMDKSDNKFYLSTNGLIVDHDHIGEQFAPTIDMSVDSLDKRIFNGDVNVILRVNDNPSGAEERSYDGVSGIKKVTFEVYDKHLGEAVKIRTQPELGSEPEFVYENEEENPEFDQIEQFLSRQLTVFAEKNNSNQIEIVATAEDNAGNITVESQDIMIDITPPKVLMWYNPEEKPDDDYNDMFNSPRTLTIQVTERNFDPDNTVLVVSRDGEEQDVKLAWNETLGSGNLDDTIHTAEYIFDEEGDYVVKLEKCIDLAGNEASDIQFKEGSISPDAFSIDMNVPVIEVSYDNNDNNDDEERFDSKGYYDAERTAEIKIMERYFDPNRVKFDIQADNTNDEYAAPVLPGELDWGPDPDDPNNPNIHIAHIPFNGDANYTFSVSARDKANNQSAEFTEQSFVVDKTKPSGAIKIDEHGPWEKLVENILTVITFGIYKKTPVTVTATGADVTSPYYIEIVRVPNTKMLTKDELDKLGEEENSPGFEKYYDSGTMTIEEAPEIVVEPNEQMVVYIRVTDYAGNYVYIRSDGVILDEDPCKISYVVEAPNKNNIHNKDVRIDVSVTDEGTYSGISLIEYWVKKDGVETYRDKLFEFTNNSPAQEDLVDKKEVWFKVLAQDNNSSNVEVFIRAVDNAGNEYITESIPLDIDVSNPEIEVSYYNNESMFDNGYYNNKRTATIDIYERDNHFNPDNVLITIKDKDGKGNDIDHSDGQAKDTYVIHGWSNVLNEQDPDKTKHTIEIDYLGNANYEFDISCIDDADNPNEGVDFKGSKDPNAFTVDLQKPNEGTIKVESNIWRELLEKITFGLYTNDKYSVTIDGKDELSGVHEIWYWVAEGDDAKIPYNTKALQNKKNNNVFKLYQGKFDITKPEAYVIYACIVDNAGNEHYVSSNGMIIDKGDGLINLSFRSDMAPNYQYERQAENELVSIPVFSNDVYIDVVVRDQVNKDESAIVSSGIKKISYRVLVNDRPIKINNEENITLFEFDNSNPSYDDLVFIWDNQSYVKDVVAYATDTTNEDDVVIEVTVWDNADNEYTESIAFGINIDNPSMEWKIDGEPKTTEGDRGYYQGGRESTIYITDRTTSFNPDGLVLDVSARDANGEIIANTYTMDEDWNILASDGNKTTYAKTVRFTGEAYYDIALWYENKNRRSVSSNDENNFTTKGDTPLHFTIDNTPPTGSITATKVYIDQDGVEQQQSISWDKLIDDETLRFGFYSSGRIDFSGDSFDAMAGVKSIHYYVVEGETSAKPLPLSELKSLGDNWKDSLDSVVDDKTFVVYVRIMDKSDNEFYLSTNGLIVDHDIIREQFAPAVDMNVDSLTDRIFNGDVNVTLSVNDNPNGTEERSYDGVSGIKKVTFEVYDKHLGEDNKIQTQSELVYEQTIENPEFDQIEQFLSRQLTVIAEKNNSNLIQLVAIAEDNAGNITVESQDIQIDITSPEVLMWYDNNVPDIAYENVFNTSRTLTIQVTERNFDPNNTVLVVSRDGEEQDVKLSWDETKGSGNLDDTIHMAEYRFDEEGDYEVKLEKCVDLAGKEASVIQFKEGSISPDAFSIDMTAPVIEVSYDNNDNNDDEERFDSKEYYDAERTAEIKIIERYFDPNRVKFDIQADNTNDEYVAPVLPGELDWGPDPDDPNVHIAHIPFNGDANYTFNVSARDKAYHQSDEYPEQKFTVDKTNPTGSIKIDENGPWEDLIENVLSVITFGIYKKTPVTVTATGADVTSPYYIEIVRVPDTKMLARDELDKLGEDGNAPAFEKYYDSGTMAPEEALEIIVEPNEQMVVYIRVTDYTGRYVYIRSDGAVVDNEPCKINYTVEEPNDKGFYNHDVHIEATVSDPEPYSGIKYIEYWVEKDGVETIREPLFDYYEKFDFVNDFPSQKDLVNKQTVSFSVVAMDNNSSEAKVFIKAIDNAENEFITEVIYLDIDVSAPVIEVSYDNNESMFNNGYYDKKRIATVDIFERTNHFDPNKVKITITDKDAEGNDIVHSSGQRNSTDTYWYGDWVTYPDQENPDNDKHTLSIFYNGNANYTFDIEYTDEAGNPNEGVNYKDSKDPTVFTVDLQKPYGTITATSAEGRESTWDDLERRDLFSFFSKEQIDISYTQGDKTSPLFPAQYYEDISQRAVDATSALTKEELDGKEWMLLNNYSRTPNVQYTTYVKIMDYAGNYDYIRTDGLIVDNELAISEFNAPLITLNNVPAENDIYAGNVRIDVAVEDPMVGGTYSGLKRVDYEIYDMTASSTEPTQAGGLYEFQIEDSLQSDLQKDFAGFIDVDSALNNSNEIKVVVYAEDNAGNISSEDITIKIDVTPPTIDVWYENNNVDSERYFKDIRVAHLIVTERNFDPSRTSITVQSLDGGPAYVGDWVEIPGNGNGDNTRHEAIVRYEADGHYTFTMETTDLAGWKADSIHYQEGTQAAEDFYVDRTLPLITVAYDNNDVRNGNYYNAARVATIVIHEHNEINQERFIAKITADSPNGVAVPVKPYLERRGDDWVGIIAFDDDDAFYTVDYEFTDLAGNIAADFTEEQFYVDQTKPEVKILGIENESANKDVVAPYIEYSDTNFEKIRVELNGSRFGQKVSEEIGGQSGTYQFNDFPHEQQWDDIYTLTGKVTDMAGNESEDDAGTIMFSVNRFGSTFDFDVATKELNQTYVQIPRDITIIETNVDPLTSIVLTVFKGGETLTLRQGTDYIVNHIDGEGGWNKYEYRIYSSVFSDDAVYRVVVNSEDEAGNTMQSTNSVELNFGVDGTKPTINVVDLESEITYPVDSKEVPITIKDNLRLNHFTVTLDGVEIDRLSGEELENFVLDGGTYTLTIPESEESRTLKIEAEDEAGNVEEIIIENFYVTTNLLVRIMNDKKTPFATGVGAVALIGGVFVVLSKRRKKSEAA